MNNMSYNDFIKDFNDKKIKKLIFSVDNYNHYKHCEIETKVFISPYGKESFGYSVQLTNDKTEFSTFSFPFEEKQKLFKIGRNTTYTLKQIWQKLTLKSIVYFDNKNEFNKIMPPHLKIKD